jgi:murein DD-endopeptidase MepM/ murein hydrolase activator NlpD
MKKKFLLALGLVAGLAVVAYFWLSRHEGGSPRDSLVDEWIRHPESHTNWAVKAGGRCGQAPFILPTNGFIGYLWNDTFDPSHRHQGIDIFGGDLPGHVPVLAAADGYLTRLADWKSTVIVRLPVDPLQPERQIWTYYTHMADAAGAPTISEAFPAGTREVFVKAGTLLGYQGNFSGTPGNPVGVHLHFSIVLDDGQGSFRNELKIENTLDPSPYLGLNLDAAKSSTQILLCP